MMIPVAPMGAVRMTGRGKWVKPNAQRYLSYKNMVGYHLRRVTGENPTEFAVTVNVVFYMPIPQSWNKKKRAEAIGKPHTVKPDLDNLIKGFFDAANGILWKDDNQVMRCVAEKVYSDEPGIEFEYKAVF